MSRKDIYWIIGILVAIPLLMISVPLVMAFSACGFLGLIVIALLDALGWVTIPNGFNLENPKGAVIVVIVGAIVFLIVHLLFPDMFGAYFE